MHLWGISPFGPIFGKELRTASRRKRNYLLRVAYLGGLLLFLLLAYTITRESFGYNSVSARQQQQEQLGWFFFMFFSMFSVAAMGLIGPVVTSTAINAEREHKTLHVLLMTPLNAWQIVSGKLFSRLLTALTLIGLSLPVLALVRLLGGVELWQMFAVVALSAVIAMVSAAMGLLLSILMRRAYAVIILSYLLIGFAYLFVPLMTLAFIAGSRARSTRIWMEWVSMTNPFWCAGMIASGQGRVVTVHWGTCVIIHLVLTAVLLMVSALLVRRLARREGDTAIALPPPLASGIAAPRGFGPEDAPYVAPLTRPGRTVSDHPVLWRELRRPLMTRRWQRVVGVIAGSLLMIVSYFAAGVNGGLDEEELQIFYACVFHVLLMLLACVISATAIAQEKESDTWTILLASPLSGAATIWGKAIGCARRLLWPMVAVAAHFLIFTAFGVITPVALVTALLVIGGFNSIWIATGLYLSLRCRKVTVAVIANLALPVLLYGVLSLLLAVISELASIRNGSLIEQVTWWLPFYYLTEVMSGGGWQGNSLQLPGHRGSRVPPGEFLSVVMIVAMLHIGVAVGMLAWTARRFNAIVGRASQRDAIPNAPVTSARTAAAGLRP